MKREGIIGVAYHKKYFTYKDDIFTPIHVGAKSSNIILDYTRDDSGDNISLKNKYYCELTGIYWMWKNVDADFYGLMHYRRYLMLDDTFKHKIKRILYYIGRRLRLRFIINKLKMNELYQIKTDDETYVKRKIEEFSENIPNLMKKYDIIIPKKEYFEMKVYEQYKVVHISEHMDILLEIIKEKYIDIYPYFEKRIKNGIYSYCTNMFVMKKEYFEKYSAFIFDVLFELEKRITIPSETYQSRVFGFLSERLMSPFVTYLQEEKNVKIKELNILFLDK